MSIVCRPLHRLIMALAAIAALASLPGCGGTVAAAGLPGQSTPVSTSEQSPDPDMVMVNLGDLGFHTSTISMTAQQPVMLMVVNRGQKTHEFGLSMRVARLQVASPAETGEAPLVASSDDVDIEVAPGQEIDATFVPLTAGSFGLIADKVPAGHVVVAN